MGGRHQRKITPMCEYLKITSSFHWFSYKHLAFLDIQRFHSAVAMRVAGGTVGGSQPHSVVRGFKSGLVNSKECSSQGELLLYTP